MPKISVIVPCYNVADYIAECMESLLNQTLSDIEIVCINDASTDNTLSVIRKYEKKDKRIRIIALDKNSGVSFARNTGINSATGTYISFMDPDDFLPNENTLKNMYNAAISSKAKICGGSIVFYKNDQIQPDSSAGFAFNKDGLMNYADWPYDYGFTRFIYERKLLIDNKIYFPKYRRQEDPIFFINAMAQAGDFYALKEPTYVYRISHKNICWSEEIIIDIFTAITECLKLSKTYNLNGLQGSIIKHINDSAQIVKPFKNSKAVKSAVCDAFSQINPDWLDKAIPDDVYIKIFKSCNQCLYKKYTQNIILRKRVYLFNIIPVIRISYAPAVKYIKILGWIPLLKVEMNYNIARYYLFNFIPLFKIKA